LQDFLVNSDDWLVRRFVVRNPKTPQDALSHLANDDVAEVIEEVTNIRFKKVNCAM
jgi:hypothetical protein